MSVFTDQMYEVDLIVKVTVLVDPADPDFNHRHDVAVAAEEDTRFAIENYVATKGEVTFGNAAIRQVNLKEGHMSVFTDQMYEVDLIVKVTVLVNPANPEFNHHDALVAAEEDTRFAIENYVATKGAVTFGNAAVRQVN